MVHLVDWLHVIGLLQLGYLAAPDVGASWVLSACKPAVS